jgi:hypothetical protein
MIGPLHSYAFALLRPLYSYALFTAMPCALLRMALRNSEGEMLSCMPRSGLRRPQLGNHTGAVTGRTVT